MTSAFIPVALGAFGLLVAFFVYQWIKKSPVGSGPEKDIAGYPCSLPYIFPLSYRYPKKSLIFRSGRCAPATGPGCSGLQRVPWILEPQDVSKTLPRAPFFLSFF